MDAKLLKSLLMLGSVVEARDPYTGGHLWRVAQYAKILGGKLGLPADERLRLTLGAFVHDLGKVAIPDAVLLKEGPLTNNEFAIIRRHPSVGASLLQEHPLGHWVVDIVEHHHERMDGHGYPGLREGQAPSLNAQIVGLADTFDALTSTRPYRPGKSIPEALQAIAEESGRQFAQKHVEILRGLAESGALSPIVRHSAENRLLVPCPRCGPVIAVQGGAEEGDTVACRACAGIVRLHRSGDTWQAEFTDTYAAPGSLVPQPDVEAVEYHLAALA